MKLTVLGCGDAFGSEGRYNTSFLLEADGQKILIDCGATTLVRLHQLGIDVASVDTILITHFHGDHYGGLPFLMLAQHFKYPKTHPITVIGPEGIQEKSYQLQEALYPGTGTIPDEVGVRYLEYSDTEELHHDELKILARKVTHAPPSNPHGIRLHWKDKVFGFSGDTEWDDALLDLADGTDLFIVECNNYQQESPGHLSYTTLMKRRAKLKTKRLVLSHMGSEMIHQRNIEIERLIDGMELEF